jgi:hypothetical protein
MNFPRGKETHLTNKSKQPKQRLNSNRTRRSAKHAQPTTAPDIDSTDPPAPVPPSRTQSAPTTQALPSTTDPATPQRAATVLADHIRTIVDSFPPLTPEQRDRIATLLRTRDNRR